MARSLIIVLFIFLSFRLAPAQVTGGGSMFQTDQLLEQSLEQKMSADKLLTDKVIPVGNVVDPDYYKVGPDDILSIQITPFMITEQLVKVTPQNTILIPRIAKEVSLKDKTLNEALATIDSVAKERNPNAQTVVSLQQARKCLVEIRGNIKFPGTYILPASYNISTALKWANMVDYQEKVPMSLTASVFSQEAKEQRNNEIFVDAGIAPEINYSERHIRLLRNSGKSMIVDLMKAEAANDQSQNPYIMEGDDIFVPYPPEDFRTISVSGAVLKPTVVAYKPGDNVSLLLDFAFGLNDYADINNVYYVNPATLEKVFLQVDENLNLLSEDFPVHPQGMVIAGKRDFSEKNKLGVVSVTGEVAQAGVYPIRPGETRLTEAIEAAGGLSNKAYLPLAKIYRRSEDSKPIEEQKHAVYEEYHKSILMSTDTNRFFLDVLYRRPIVSTDFPLAFQNENSKENVTLEDGDVIVIPENPRRVYVYGQVKKPGYVEFEPGKPAEYYIARAGGYTAGADEGRASIVRGSSRIWLEVDDDAQVYSGDDIYVPNPPDEPPGTEFQRYSVLVQGVFAFVSIVSLVFNILQANK